VGGDWAAEAEVTVYRADGQLLGKPGVLDDRGKYVFQYEKAEELKVVVAQDGHRKELKISAKELGAPEQAAAPPAAPQETAPPVHYPVWELVAGLSFVLAAAAFYLSVRTARRVRELQRLSLPPLLITPPPNVPPPNTAFTAAPPATGTPRPKALPTGPNPG
jgi:hypothetical protein